MNLLHGSEKGVAWQYPPLSMILYGSASTIMSKTIPLITSKYCLILDSPQFVYRQKYHTSCNAPNSIASPHTLRQGGPISAHHPPPPTLLLLPPPPLHYITHTPTMLGFLQGGASLSEVRAAPHSSPHILLFFYY